MTQSDDTGATNATPKKARRVLYSDAKIIAALKATNGGAYLAASRLGCEPSTIYRRADKNPKVQAVMDTMRGELVDLAEAALKKAVAEREGWAVCFTLKTQGKQRGYVERQEHDVTVRPWREAVKQHGADPDAVLAQVVIALRNARTGAGGDSDRQGGDEAAPED
jgi:hypothetical protein